MPTSPTPQHSLQLKTLVVSPQGSTTWECGAWTPLGLRAFSQQRPDVLVLEEFNVGMRQL